MKKRNEPVETSEEVEEIALTPKEQKKLKQKESIEKRKSARRRDKVARWGGLILLGLMMFIGFLLWVAGEMNQEVTMPKYQNNTLPINQQNSVIVR